MNMGHKQYDMARLYYRILLMVNAINVIRFN